MQKLRERMKDQKGFTLVELLIVVAIIAILIAISIPMVGQALEKAKDAVDDANFRDASALGSIQYLQDPETGAGTYWYVVNENSQQGRLEKSDTKPSVTSPEKVYVSKCTGGPHGVTNTEANKSIKVVVANDGKVTVSWEN